TGKLQCLESRERCKLQPPRPGLANVERALRYCALVADGTVRCWRDDHSIIPIPGVAGAVSLVEALSHWCALLRDGEVTCWGQNKNGELGRGEADEDPHWDARPVRF